MTVRGYHTTVTGACGMGVVFDFRNTPKGRYEEAESLKKGDQRCSGCDMFSSGFIDNAVCKEAYETLTKHFRLVFQTSIRVNRNSDNRFFFCVFDRRTSDKAKTDMPTLEASWPFDKTVEMEDKDYEYEREGYTEEDDYDYRIKVFLR